MTEPLPGIAQQQQNVDVSALRESMMNRQQARPRKNRHRASILLSKDGFSRGKHTKQMEDKLGEQFKYFRQEFLDAALSVGVPVPLDMVEDKAGRVFTFVNQKGPRYLFQIMHSNPESPHLLRCSLSLLIVTISILRGKLPQTSSITNEKSAHVWLSLLTENVSAWALDSLTTIADGSAVAICTNLLRHSHSQTIQELILNLLAHLVNITEEAANQMLLYPTITSSDTPQKPQDVKDLDQDRGAATPMGRPLLSETQSSRRSELPSVRSLVGHAREKKANSVENDDNFTCLSYMFSVVAHHRNRYTVMTACAEVVLALVANKSALICEEIARTAISPVIMDTFTGEQRTTSNRNFGGNRGHMKPSFGGNASSTANGTLRMKSTASPPAEWAALKLMLKFLQRFMRYAQSAVQDDNSTVTSADSTANRSPAQTPGSRIRCNVDIAVVPHKHKNSLCTAHARVLLAVCELIIYSPNVASFVLTMPGARAIMKASCMLHKDSPDIGQSVVQCLHVLQRESERVYEIMSSNRHSMSYELTHGRASKLFNPVSALTSKRVGLRSSAGSRQKRAM